MYFSITNILIYEKYILVCFIDTHESIQFVLFISDSWKDIKPGKILSVAKLVSDKRDLQLYKT